MSLKGKKVKEQGGANALLAWYDKNRRVLPWRALRGEKPDPYRVWLSEIMLQQTTVATVGPYFERFMARWPTLEALAKAKETDILRLWAGLGYYRRARLLHQCARHVQKVLGGIFPQDVAELKTLPGVGDYTAAAIAAIAFDRPANVVDGNVERVMARRFCIEDALPKAKPLLRNAAEGLVPKRRCGDYAQALMDLGATVCTPRSPRCESCPWAGACEARAEGKAESLPRRQRAAPKPIRRAVAFVLWDGHGKILLRQRPDEGLLAGMMEVPSSPWQEGKRLSLVQAKAYAPMEAGWKEVPGVVKHIFSHFVLEILVLIGTTEGKVPKGLGVWVDPDRLDDEALPSVMKKIVRHGRKRLY